MKKDYLGGILGVGFISANTLGGGASISMSLLKSGKLKSLATPSNID